MLTTTFVVSNSTPIPPHITRNQVLSFLHSTKKMLTLNPFISEVRAMPSSHNSKFYNTVPKRDKPVDVAPCETFHITELPSARSDSAGGSWIQKFMPKMEYESGFEMTPNGVITITHAPLGINSVTTWTLRDDTREAYVLENQAGVAKGDAIEKWQGDSHEDGIVAAAKEAAGVGGGEGGKEGGLVIEVLGRVETNVILMSFIRKMLPRDFQELAERFLEKLQEDVDKTMATELEKV